MEGSNLMNKKNIADVLAVLTVKLADTKNLTKAEKLMVDLIPVLEDFLEAEKPNNAKATHHTKECFELMTDVFGKESAYIYANMQVCKHLYYYEYNLSDEEYAIAEWYKAQANRLEKELGL